MSSNVNQTPAVVVDGKRVPINNQKNLLELIRGSGVDLPTFCYHSELSVYGACRMCLVEDSRGLLQSACSTFPADGMDVKTNTPRVQRVRRMMLELLLANHDRDCTTCTKNGRCKLQELCQRFGVNRVRFPAKTNMVPLDESTLSLVRDPNKCILCGDCVRMCAEVQGVGCIDFAFRGSQSQVMPAFGKGLVDVDCINCGQCAAVCPTAAITVRSDTDRVWAALRDPNKRVIVQMAPAVRVAIGEEFGYEPGSISTGKAVAAIRRIGFNAIYDTSFTADLTTMEETNEFVGRLLKGEKLPQFTSCCPGWVKMFEQSFPQRTDQLSSCKSPQQMLGAVAKKFWAKEEGLAAKDVFVVSIMPCTAKKFEAARPEFTTDGSPDVDAVLTTQEIAMMIREAGVLFNELEEESFDAPFGLATGSGMLFGASGGVAISAVRQAHLQLTGKRLMDVNLQPVAGHPQARSATVQVGDIPVRVGVVSGLQATRNLMAAMDKGEVAFDIVEVMACPGGCIGGGGQPLPNETRERVLRTKGMFTVDRTQQMRVAMDNPSITETYKKWFGTPNSEVAHHALHTHYGPRRRIVGEEMPMTLPVIQPTSDTSSSEISVCVGTNCFLKGSREILKRVTQEVSNRGLKDEVSLRANFCFENCEKGPTVTIGDKEISGVKPEDVPALFDAFVKVKSKVGAKAKTETK